MSGEIVVVRITADWLRKTLQPFRDLCRACVFIQQKGGNLFWRNAGS